MVHKTHERLDLNIYDLVFYGPENTVKGMSSWSVNLSRL